MATTGNSHLAVFPSFARIKQVPSLYTPAQVLQWLARIGFEHALSEDDIANDAFPKNAETLRKLSRLHLLAFPFETSAMHYQSDHFVDVSPQSVYERLVLNDKGSYCYGLNGLLLGMLRGLGFRAYGGAARVNKSRDASEPVYFQGLTHMIIFVQPCPEDEHWTYLVDVGFGGSGLSRPIALAADMHENTVLGTTPSERHRLARRVLPSSSLEIPDPQHRHPEIEYQLEVSHTSGAQPWRVLYTFSVREFYECDYEAASFDICQRPSIPFFWDGIMAVKHFLLSESEADEAKEQVQLGESLPHANGIGSRWDKDDGSPGYLGRLIMIGKEVKRSIGSRSEVLKVLTTDAERIQALREIFGVDIRDDDAVHIKGRKAALDQFE